MIFLKIKHLCDLKKKRDDENNAAKMSSFSDKINRLQEVRKQTLHHLTSAQEASFYDDECVHIAKHHYPHESL